MHAVDALPVVHGQLPIKEIIAKITVFLASYVTVTIIITNTEDFKDRTPHGEPLHPATDLENYMELLKLC